MSRLKEQYQNEIVDAMIKKFGYKNIMEVPKLDKVVINMGVGEAKDNAKLLDAAIADMEKITGQNKLPGTSLQWFLLKTFELIISPSPERVCRSDVKLH